MTRHGSFMVLGMMIFVVGWGGSVTVMAAALAEPSAFVLPCAHRTGASCPAEDVVESEGTRIIGDSDMPKALYIVPWKKPALPILSSRPVTPFVNDALSLINRESLAAQIKYNELIQFDASLKTVK